MQVEWDTRWLELSKCFCLPTAHLCHALHHCSMQCKHFYQAKPGHFVLQNALGSWSGAALILSWSVVHPWAAHTPKGTFPAQGPPEGPAHSSSSTMGMTAHWPLAHAAASLGMQGLTVPLTCATPRDDWGTGTRRTQKLKDKWNLQNLNQFSTTPQVWQLLFLNSGSWILSLNFKTRWVQELKLQEEYQVLQTQIIIENIK